MKNQNIIIIIIAIVLLFYVTSCKTKYITVPEYHYDTTYITKTQYDSLYFYDSIFVKEKGDTIYVEKTHFKTIYRDFTDTVYKYKVDSVKVPVIEEKIVEKKQPFWSRAVLILFCGLIGWFIALIIDKILNYK